MVRTRIAPSPTGIPHIGTTRTALYNYLFAKQKGGKFIVRIEDTDRERFVKGAQKKILEILHSLGLLWDEGPEVGGPYKPYVQSEKLKIYKKLAEELVKKNKAYYCFCTKSQLDEMRKKQQKAGQVPRYDRKCLNFSKKQIEKNLKENKPCVIRLKIPQGEKISWQDLIQGKIEFKSDDIDDQVLLKSDGYPTYHLGVVVDDYQMKISHVLRGVEWISSTPKHILLYKAFNWKLPIFGHLPVILGPDKAKLSKRHGAKSAFDYQKEGYLPEALNNFMVFLGWSYKDNSDLLSLKDLIKLFKLKDVRKANPTFDIEKLKWFNGQWIRKKSDQELARLLKPYLKIKLSDQKLQKLASITKERIEVLSDINELATFLVSLKKFDKNLIFKQSKRGKNQIVNLVRKTAEVLEKIPEKNWSALNLEKSLRDLRESFSDWKTREFFMIIRVITTGREVSPPLFESMEILGRDEVLKRLKRTLKLLEKS